MGLPTTRQRPQIHGAQDVPLGQNELGGHHVLAHRPHIAPRRNRLADENGVGLAGGVVGGVVCGRDGFGVFNLDNRIGPIGQRVTCVHIAGLLPHAQQLGRVEQCASGIGRTHGEAIHSRGVVVGSRNFGPDGFGKDTAEELLIQRQLFHAQHPI